MAADKAFKAYMQLGYLWRTSRRVLPRDVQEPFLDLLFACQQRVLPSASKPVSVTVAEARGEVKELLQLAKAIASRPKPIPPPPALVVPAFQQADIESTFSHEPFSGAFCDVCGIWEPVVRQDVCFYSCQQCTYIQQSTAAFFSDRATRDNLASSVTASEQCSLSWSEGSVQEGGPIGPAPTEPLQTGQEYAIFTPRPRFRTPTPYPSRTPSVDTLAGSEDSASSEGLDQPSVTAWVIKDGVWKRNSEVSDTVAKVKPLLPSAGTDARWYFERLLIHLPPPALTASWLHGEDEVRPPVIVAGPGECQQQ